jgi:hypothetical protein
MLMIPCRATPIVAGFFSADASAGGLRAGKTFHQDRIGVCTPRMPLPRPGRVQRWVNIITTIDAEMIVFEK